MMRLARVVVAAVLLVALVACSRDEDPTIEPPTDAPTETTTTTTSPTPGAPCELDGGSQDEQTEESSPPATALLTDLRHDEPGCARVVFEFSDELPSYTIGYAEPPFSECGSGDEVSTAGWDSTAYISVKMQPAATADMTKEEAPQTYTGPRDIDTGGDVLKRIRKICDFEAQLEWIIAVDERHDFLVDTQDDPSRIVIDISET